MRTGCFCNVGACQYFLKLSTTQLKKHLEAGHVCGDSIDIIDGQPTGSIRISFGYMSDFSDAEKFLNFIKDCFVEKDSDGCNENKPRNSAENNGVLKRMFIYPVKSCAALEVSVLYRSDESSLPKTVKCMSLARIVKAGWGRCEHVCRAKNTVLRENWDVLLFFLELASSSLLSYPPLVLTSPEILLVIDCQWSIIHENMIEFIKIRTVRTFFCPPHNFVFMNSIF